MFLGEGKKAKQVRSEEPSFEPAAPAEPTKVATPRAAPVKGSRTLITSEEFTLKGVTHSNYPFKDLKPGQEVFFIPDPLGAVVKPGVGHNDPGAVSVQDNEGRHIGYIDKTLAQVISKALQGNKFTVDANVIEVKGGYKGAKEMLKYGVDILARFYTNG